MNSNSLQISRRALAAAARKLLQDRVGPLSGYDEADARALRRAIARILERTGRIDAGCTRSALAAQLRRAAAAFIAFESDGEAVLTRWYMDPEQKAELRRVRGGCRTGGGFTRRGRYISAPEWAARREVEERSAFEAARSARKSLFQDAAGLICEAFFTAPRFAPVLIEYDAVDFPEWAVCLHDSARGEGGPELSDEDVQQYEEWRAAQPAGLAIVFAQGEEAESYFSRFPAFGLPGPCVKAHLYAPPAEL